MLLFKKFSRLIAKRNLFKAYPQLLSTKNTDQHMPVLKNFMRHLQKEFGNDFSKLPNRKSTLLIMVQQGFVTIRPLIEAINTLGIDPKQIMKTTKPHTTSPEMLEFFNKTFATNYVQFQWPANTTLSEATNQKDAEKTPYQLITEATHRALLDKVCNYLLRYPAPSSIKNLIIYDEGGNFLELFIERYRNTATNNGKKLSDYSIVAIEHTKCGTHSQALHQLSFPLINMADSYIKTKVASEFIAKSMFTNLKELLSSITTGSNKHFGIVGLGNIGKEIFPFLLKEYPNAFFTLYDYEPSVFSVAKIRENGWQNIVSRADSVQALFQQATIILGCTGKDITSNISLEELIINPENHLHFISCSSGNREFHSLLKKITNYRFISKNDIRDWTMQLSSDTLKKFTIYNAGFPINFQAKQTAGVPANEIQITRTITLAAIVQALKLLEIMLYSQYQEKYIQLDVSYQMKIIQFFYDGLINNNYQEQRILNAEKYKSITKKEVEAYSLGSPQPSLSDVLHIRFYVQTNYQVSMQELLEQQKRTVKRIALCGIAGSGKTILGQYYLERYQKLYPGHISRMIIAETQAQWMNSLQEWAESFGAEYAKLIRDEIDPQKQRKLIAQSIKNAMKKNSWCVVIDNWDTQNGPKIGEIEEYFNLGNGTLIITTQAESPFEKACSLNLSSGFSLEESRQLFANVVNIFKEFGVGLPRFGTDNTLNTLLRELHYLPLAIVQAGSYVFWENKARLQRGQSVFSYYDYQELLSNKVTELIEKHTQLLKNKADIPRERTETHPEFMLIKTQEAAVDLALEKSIYSEGKLKNIGLLKILFFCGFINNSSIPQKLLKHLLQGFSENDDLESQFNEALNIAQNYSLLHFDNIRSPVDDRFSIQLHRVTQKLVREKYWPLHMSILMKDKIIIFRKKDDLSFLKIGSSVTEVTLYCKMLSAFSSVLKNSIANNDNLEISKIYRDHAVMLTNKINASIFTSQELSSDLFLAVLDFYNTIASIETEVGNYHSAEMILRFVSEKNFEFYKEGQHIDAILCHRNLAVILYKLGKYEEAEAIYKKNLKLIKTYAGDDKRRQDVLSMLQKDLMQLLHMLGRSEEARSLYQEILQANNFSNNINSIENKLTLAYHLYNLGKNKEAAQMFQEILDYKIMRYATENNIKVAKIQSTLGVILDTLGQHEEAKTMLQKSITVATAHYGSTRHESIASIQNNLASSLSSLKQHAEAEKLYRDSLKTLIDHYGTENALRVADTQYNLAMNLISAGRKIEAVDFLRKSLKTKMAIFKTENQLSIADDQLQLANILIYYKCYEEAEDLLKKSLTIKTSYYNNEKNFSVADVQQVLATVLMAQNFYERAANFYQFSLNTEITLYATQQHISIAATQCNLALALARLQRHVEAENLLNQSLETVIIYCGTEHHDDVVSVRIRIADYLKFIGRYEESAAQLQRILDTQKICHNNEDNDVIANAKCELSRMLSLLGRDAEAELLFREALDAMIKHYDTERHPEIERIQQDLVNVLTKLHKNEEAESFKNKILAQKPKCEIFFNSDSPPLIFFKEADNLLITRVTAAAIHDLKVNKLYHEEKIIKEMLIDIWKNEHKANIAPLGKTTTVIPNKVLLSEYKHIAPDRLVRCAAGNGNEKDLLELLTHYPDKIDSIDRNPCKGWTALHWAVQNNHQNCVKMLLDRGAKFSICDKSTQKLSALDIALQNQDEKILLLFKEYFIKKYSNGKELNTESIASATKAAKNSGDLAVVNLFENSENARHGFVNFYL